MKNIGDELISSLLSVLFPPECPCCGQTRMRGEEPMCLQCRLEFPFTADHLHPTDNALIDKLQGMVSVERAAAYFSYRRQSRQAQVIHDMKYRGRSRYGRQLGAEFALKLRAGGFFDGIEAIAPVPLNFWRHCRRGYNQAAVIARGIAQVSGLPVIDVLTAARHRSQTRLSADRRLEALKNVYAVRPGGLDGIDHLLIVDDVCTTGATLTACINAVKAAKPSLKISAACLASTTLV